ncbi:MAG: cation diffusion facilitator family transporter [Cohaesibacter sp.]|jgi:cation diffusion facilitator family transporter|nr:cation diffusion facilitator family transporter [Cohaesibacter sp.]
MRTPISLAIGSIVVALVVLALKIVAYVLTGSIALYSDALESLVNLAASLAVLVAVWLGQKPADHNHPYGHHKAEYLSAVLEGVLIVVAAMAIFHEAYMAYKSPRILEAPLQGLAINGFAGLINGLWALVLIRQGRAIKSPAIVADGKHLLTDLLTSVGVIVGVGLAYYTGIAELDPLVAILVALSILWTGWGLIRSSVSGLMDEAIPDGELDRIRTIIAANADGAIEAHALRSRHSGKMTFLDFHLVVPSAMSVQDAHAICDRIELALTKQIPDMAITIHVEPEDMAEHKGIVVL